MHSCRVNASRRFSLTPPGWIKSILLIVGYLLGMLQVVALPSVDMNEQGSWAWTASGGKEVKRSAAGLIFNARDHGSASWSFLAPRQLLGDQRAMLGGKLGYRIGFRTSNGEWMGVDAPDIEMESAEHNITLVMRGLVTILSRPTQPALVKRYLANAFSLLDEILLFFACRIAHNLPSCNC